MAGANQLHFTILEFQSTTRLQGCIFFPWFLYPSSFILWWNYIYFIILGGVHNYETFLLLICFIIFQKSSKSCKIFTILLLICLIFLISFPVLSKVLIDLGHVYGPNRKNIYPWTQEITLSLFTRVFFIIVTNVITKLKENMILNDISNLYMREWHSNVMSVILLK